MIFPLHLPQPACSFLGAAMHGSLLGVASTGVVCIIDTNKEQKV
jgi:hypothetical protein